VKRRLIVVFMGVAAACSGSTTTIPGDEDGGGSADGSTIGDGGTSPDGAPPPRDAAGDAECQTSADCKPAGPDTCNICKSPLNHLVCAGGACVCGCRADAG
jgi:hypothetical protein